MFHIGQIANSDYILEAWDLYQTTNSAIEDEKKKYKSFGEYLNQYQTIDFMKPKYFGDKITHEGQEIDINKMDFDTKSYESIFQSGNLPNGQRPPGTKDHGTKTKSGLILDVPKAFGMKMILEDRDKYEQMRRELRQEAQQFIMDEIKPLLKPSMPAETNKYKEMYSKFDPKKTKAYFCDAPHDESRWLQIQQHEHIELPRHALFTLPNEKGEIEEKWLAVDPVELYKKQKEISVKWNIKVAQLAKKWNWELTKDKQVDFGFGVKGISDEAVNMLSDGKKAVLEELKKDDVAGEYQALRNLKNRYSYELGIKNNLKEDKKAINYNDLFDRMKDEVKKAVLKPVNSTGTGSGSGSGTTDLMKKLKDLAKVSDDELKYHYLCENVININGNVDEAYKKWKDLAVDMKLLIELTDGKYATGEAIKIEHEFNDLVVNKLNNMLPGQDRERLQRKLIEYEKSLPDNKKLTKAQKQACEMLIMDKPAASIYGYAGSGKTDSVLKFINQASTELGKKVFGFSTSDKAVKSIKDAGVDSNNCFNMEQITTRIKSGTFKEKNAVFLIDESSMISTENMLCLTKYAFENNCKTIFIGDSKQLLAVNGIGNAFDIINQNIPKDSIAVLSDNMRQRKEEHRKAVDLIRNGKIELAFEAIWRDVKIKDKEEDIFKELADMYVRDKEPNKQIIAYTNKTVNRLNDVVREKLIENGTLDKRNQLIIETPKKQLKIAIGEQIAITKKLKIGKDTLINNTSGIVKEIKDNQILFEYLDDKKKAKTIWLDMTKKEHRNINHCYAMTAHKAQGQSIESVYVFGESNQTLNRLYSEISRVKGNLTYFATKEVFEKIKEEAKHLAQYHTTLNDSIAENYYQSIKATQIKPIIDSPKSQSIPTGNAFTDKGQVVNLLRASKTFSLSLVSDELRDDKDIAEMAMLKTKNNYQYLSDRLKHDLEIVMLGVRMDPNIYPKIDDELKKSPEVCLALMIAGTHHINKLPLQYQSAIKNKDPIEHFKKMIVSQRELKEKFSNLRVKIEEKKKGIRLR